MNIIIGKWEIFGICSGISLALSLLYFILQPGFEKLIRETPDGVVLNVVPPSIYLVLAIVALVLGWVIVDAADDFDEGVNR